jgi:hypothetical protein
VLVALVIGEVGPPAVQSVLLVHEEDAANGSLRRQAHLFQQPHRLHHHGHAGTVIDRAGAEVPGVEVAADEDDLVRPFAAADLRDHVRRFDIRQRAWREHEMHAHALPFLQEPIDEHRVFRRHRRRGDLRKLRIVVKRAGVRRAQRRRADRANERGHGAEFRGSAGT